MQVKFVESWSFVLSPLIHSKQYNKILRLFKTKLIVLIFQPESGYGFEVYFLALKPKTGSIIFSWKLFLLYLSAEDSSIYLVMGINKKKISFIKDLSFLLFQMLKTCLSYI